MIKKNDVTLKEGLQEMFDELRLTPQLKEARIKALWEQLMGKTIATYTTDISVKQQTLYLNVISATLRHDLNFRKQEILDLLNGHLGENYLQSVVIK
ncbi:MAG: DUF721 domain-containing protein [Saprospiraceae bacterium]